MTNAKPREQKEGEETLWCLPGEHSAWEAEGGASLGVLSFALSLHLSEKLTVTIRKQQHCLVAEYLPCLLEALGLERTSTAKQIPKTVGGTQTQKRSSYMDSELTHIKSDILFM